MGAVQDLRRKLDARIYGDVVARWRDGTLDDRAFERAYNRRAQAIVQPVMFLVVLVPAALDWLHRDLSIDGHLDRLWMWLMLYGVFAFAFGVQAYRFARFGSRDLLIRRRREQAEQNPKLGLSTKAASQGAAGVYGRFSIAAPFANRILLLALACDAITGGLFAYTHRVSFLMFVAAALTLWAIFMRFDRRIVLDVSPEGIQCRRWGPRRYRFDQFKAVYPRQRAINVGVVLVPRAPAEIAPTLSWWGRYHMKSGDGVPAHAGTLTVWTNQVGLNREAFLDAMQSEIVKAA